MLMVRGESYQVHDTCDGGTGETRVPISADLSFTQITGIEISLQKVQKKGGKLMSPNKQDHLAASLMSSRVESGI